MAVTSLSIESEKIEPNGVSAIAIGEPLPFVVTINADAAGSFNDHVTVSIRLVSDDSIVESPLGPMQRIYPFTITLASLIIQIEDKFDVETGWLTTSQGMKLGQNGDGDGRYYLYAELESDQTKNSGPDNIFLVVLMTVWMVQNVLFAGIPFVDANDEPLDETMITTGIRYAISAIETAMGFSLYPKHVKTRGQLNPNPTDYDYVRSPVTYKREHFQGAPIRLRDTYVNKVISLSLGYGSMPLTEIPPEWMNLRREYGHIRLMYFANPLISNPSGLFFWNLTWGSYITDGWYAEYMAGWDETLEPYPPDLINAIGFYTTLQIGTDWGDAISLGITNSSISLDGVSASLGRTANAVTGILGAKIAAAEKKKTEWFKMFSARYRPTTIAFLGGRD